MLLLAVSFQNHHNFEIVIFNQFYLICRFEFKSNELVRRFLQNILKVGSTLVWKFEIYCAYGAILDVFIWEHFPCFHISTSFLTWKWHWMYSRFGESALRLISLNLGGQITLRSILLFRTAFNKMCASQIQKWFFILRFEWWIILNHWLLDQAILLLFLRTIGCKGSFPKSDDDDRWPPKFKSFEIEHTTKNSFYDRHVSLRLSTTMVISNSEKHQIMWKSRWIFHDSLLISNMTI